MIYQSTNHAKFLLKYHLILICKYRHNLLERLGDIIKSLILEIFSKEGCSIDIMEVDKDHLHIMFSTTPNINLSKFVNKIKSFTTYHIWRFDEYTTKFLYTKFWIEKTFWSDSYFISSVGNASEETIRDYIRNQGG